MSRAAAGVLVAAVLAAAPATAGAATVTVRAAAGPPRTVALDPLLAAPDVTGRPYAVRTAAGAATRTVTGASLGAVLRAADADVDAFRFAELTAADGRSVLLPRAVALRAAGGEPPPPVVATAAVGAVTVLRPSAGRDDRNGDDELPADGLTVTLRERARLTVAVAASDPTPAAGRPVTLTARVGGVAAGERARVRWLVDGAGASGTEIVRRFAGPGPVRVLATVTTDADAVGASDVLVLRVGADKEASRRPGTGAADDDAGASGAGDGAGAAGGGAGATAGRAATSSTDDDNAAAAAPEPDVSSGRDRPTPARRTPRERDAGDGPVPGEVEGELLVAAAPPAPARPAAPASVAPGADDPRAAGVRLPPEVWATLGVLAALALGVARERRAWRGAAR